jgi:hypothetical protein
MELIGATVNPIIRLLKVEKGGKLLKSYPLIVCGVVRRFHPSGHVASTYHASRKSGLFRERFVFFLTTNISLGKSPPTRPTSLALSAQSVPARFRRVEWW